MYLGSALETLWLALGGPFPSSYAQTNKQHGHVRDQQLNLVHADSSNMQQSGIHHYCALYMITHYLHFPLSAPGGPLRDSQSMLVQEM